jgi:hypothetical protein
VTLHRALLRPSKLLKMLPHVTTISDMEESIVEQPLPDYLQQMFPTPSSERDAAVSHLPEGCSARWSRDEDTSKDREARFARLLLDRHQLTQSMAQCPGPCPDLILRRAKVYCALGYGELALADAYISYTLCLVSLDGPELSDLVPVKQNGEPWPTAENDQDETESALVATKHKYQSLLLLLWSAITLGAQSQAQLWIDEVIATKHDLQQLEGLQSPDVTKFKSDVRDDLLGKGTMYQDLSRLVAGTELEPLADSQPFLFGWSQRQRYPWNEHEPDRLSPASLEEINEKLHEAAPDLDAKISVLPALAPDLEQTIQNLSIEQCDSDPKNPDTSSQLGLFARTQLSPGATVLTERTALAGIRPHGEALCDACAADLESIDPADRRYCPGCHIPFCSEDCKVAAAQRYHFPNEEDDETDEGYPPEEAPFCPGTIANEDIHNLGRAESSTTPEWDLYFLLLSRTLQMAETQDKHPLDLFEIKYLWGDFSPTPTITNLPVNSGPKTLPYSVRHHVELPLQWFEILMKSREGCTPYTAAWLEKYDWWIIQTLFAKFRGVADAKQSTWTGKPEVAAVHPLWCLANHSCNPNVTWKPLGLRNLTVVQQRIWSEPDKPSSPWQGIEAGEEIFNHYTDIRERDCRERRERLNAVLGGDCRCERCAYESIQR